MKGFCIGFAAFTIISVFAQEEILIADFEGNDYGQWQIEGTAFGLAPFRVKENVKGNVKGFLGKGLASSSGGEMGELTSPAFQISRDYLAFLIGGGGHPETGVELWIGEKVLRAETGGEAKLKWVSWDLSSFRGKQAVFRIFDRHQKDSIHVDHIVLLSRPRGHWEIGRLADYRKKDLYYRERYRPQFHFTPEMNWMNDPNGMVYFRGEYHLFYQHNPHGNRWGHMSWGHAISRDMLHWEHLPLGIPELYGVMIFSGSAVVDWRNTSGLGKGSEPPLIAIYTGHGHGKQTQDIAFSNDRGRTWQKYSGNPVIDLNEANFRDPKIFWHESSKQWLMIVSMARDLYVQFYGSPNLLDWTLLSRFGPAGAKSKSNWECPDLFELPIEGSDETRWVLEVDMGSGAIAGGSGGEYFIGHFDGKAFHAEHPLDQVRWVDYGRDFYAPVSWSDIPQSDGRRLWLGWMNNWQTSILPTHPWRGAMSLPRSLALRKTPEGLRMVQDPVKELQAIRGQGAQMESQMFDGTIPLSKRGIAGDCFEIIAEFELRTASELGFRLRKGKDEETIVGYDVKSKSMFVDRTDSGEVDFHPAFAGRHFAPLPIEEGSIELRIFVDTSSIEVFGNRGYSVITDRIFPSPESQEIELYSRGGSAWLKSLRFWHLNSTWHNK